jgi:RimJ/RimL family protein N-acetyltransferase
MDSTIIGNKVRLRGKRLADAPLDYSWQIDLELAQLDAAPQLNISFQQYLSEYTRELRYPSLNRQRFAIETRDGRHIGNCTYYGIDEAKGEAELGIIIGDRDYWDKGYGASTVTAIVNHIFQNTKLNRIYLKTLETNTRARKCFTKCGFAPYGHLNRDGYNFLLMELNRKQWLKQAEAKEE